MITSFWFFFSKQLLDEGAVLSIYDPKVTFEQIVDDLADSTTDIRLVTCENDEVAFVRKV